MNFRNMDSYMNTKIKFEFFLVRPQGTSFLFTHCSFPNVAALYDIKFATARNVYKSYNWTLRKQKWKTYNNFGSHRPNFQYFSLTVILCRRVLDECNIESKFFDYIQGITEVLRSVVNEFLLTGGGCCWQEDSWPWPSAIFACESERSPLWERESEYYRTASKLVLLLNLYSFPLRKYAIASKKPSRTPLLKYVWNITCTKKVSRAFPFT